MFASSFSPTGSETEQSQFHPDADGSWTLPETLALFTAEYGRDGQDLILQTVDGQQARLVDYFATEPLADLVAHDGAVLRGTVVDRLAGPLFPAQYAQAGGANLAEAIGQVETLTGSAFAQRTDGSTVELEIGTKVFQGDVVRTENGSTLGLTFADGTIFTLASGSRMVLDELIYDPQANDNSGIFNLVEGSFVFIAGQAAKTGGIEINSPAATMGIRGTTGKIDIQTTNGITTVTVSLNPDPDGGLGAIELFDLAGNLITTITGTDTKWIISPPFTNEPPLEVERETTDLGDDSVLLSQAVAAFQSAITRVQQGETFVELPEGDGDVPDDGQAPDEGQPPVEETDEGSGQTDPIAPPPLDETGDDQGEAGESGSGNPELDGQDEQIIDQEPGGNEDDDASLQQPAGDQGTQVAENNSRAQLSDLSVSSVEDTALTTQLPISGGEAGTIPVTLSRGAENGLVVLAADGTFTYTPDPDFQGTDTFEISGTDTDGSVQTAVITVVVDPVNDAPVATFRTARAASLEEGADAPDGSGSVSGRLTYLDVDEGDETAVWTIEADADNATAFGTVTIDAQTGEWRYELDQDATDTLGEGDVFEETFTATVTDQEGASDVSLLVITVTGTNDAPQIVANVEQTSASLVTGPGAATFDDPDVVTTGTVSGQLEYSDVDEGPEAATWSVRADADNETELGTISIDADTGEWTYVLSGDPGNAPGNGETVTEVYTATVTDANGASASQAILISVIGTNDAPEIVFSIEDVSATVVEDGFGTGQQSRVAVGDDGLRARREIDDSEQLIERRQANTDGGSNATGTLRYVDADGQPGAATWTVEAENASLGSMNIDTVTGEWHYFLDEEAANSLREGDEVIETFIATVTDPFGATASQVITITVQGSNDEAEIVTAPQDLVGNVAEEGVLVATGQLNFVDPDAAPGETATWSVTPDGNSRGSMVIDADTGAWTYTLDPIAANSLQGGEIAIETFTATVTDSFGAQADQTITISLAGQNDGPTLIAGSASLAKQETDVIIDLDALGADADAGEDGSTLIYAITSEPGEGSASVSGTELTFSTGGAFDDLSEGQSRDVTIEITATDASGSTATNSLTITVTGTNTAPVITSDISAAQGAVTEDTGADAAGNVTTSGVLTYTDLDASTPTSGVWSVLPGASARGSIAIDPTSGAWTYTLNGAAKDTLNAGETVTERFTATIRDEDGQTDSQEIAIDITGTNDIPVLSSGTGSVLKDAVAVAVDLTALGSDPDAEDDGSSLTYALADGYEGSGSFEVQGNSLVFEPEGDFNDLGAGDTRNVAVDIVATDSRGAVSDTATVTITVTGTATGPSITSTALDAQGSVTEQSASGGEAGFVAGQLTYSDADEAAPGSGTWTIAPQTSALGSITIGASTGAWTYTLNNVAADSLDDGDFVEEFFTATITDADGFTATQVIQIGISGSNDAPVITAQTETVDKTGPALVLDLADFTDDPDANDTDASLTFEIATPPGSGTASLSGSELTFDPGSDFDDLDAGDSRIVTVVVRATDGASEATTATIEITVTGSNDAPVITSTALDAQGSAQETGIGVPDPGANPVATGQLSFTDDSPGASWSVDPLGTVAIGSMTIGATTGTWEYFLPAAAANNLGEGETAQDRFTATITDSFGLTDTQEITITITGTNDQPVIQVATSELSGTAGSGGPATLTGNILFADPDNIISDSVAWSIEPAIGTTGTFGTMTISGAGQWVYSVNSAAIDGLPEGAVRTENYVAIVRDEFGATDNVSVVIRIDGTNLPPVITSEPGDASGSVTEHGDAGSGTQFVTGTLTYDDPDEGATPGTWSVTPVGTPALGSLAIVPNTGAWTYALNDAASDSLDAGDTVTEQFTATIEDVDGGTATQVITITINGTNDSPILTVGAPTGVGQDGTTSVDLRAVASDADADDTPALLNFAIATGPAKGTASLVNGTLNFDTNGEFASLGAGATEDVTIDVTVSDNQGGQTTSTVTIRVSGANDAPVITSVAAAAEGSITEQGVTPGLPTSIGGTLTYSDSDEGPIPADVWSVTPLNSPFGGITIGATNGVWEYTLDQAAADALNDGETRTEQFTATVTDVASASADQIITVTITGSNDAPTLSAGVMAANENGGTVTLDLTTLGGDVDAEDDAASLTYSLNTPPAEASLTDETLSFDPSGFQSLAAGQTQQVTVSVTAEDAQGATATNDVVVTVTGVNDDPTLAAGTLAALEDGGAVTLDLSTLGADLDDGQDGSTLTYALQAPVDGASVSGSTLTFTPPFALQSLTAGETTDISVNIVANDGAGGSVVGTVVVTVTGQNDAPGLANSTLAATEDGPEVSLDLSLFGLDIDTGEAGSLAYALVAEHPNATVSGNTFFFDPGTDFQDLAEGQTRDVEIDVRATDPFGLQATGTVTVTVSGVNDAPDLQPGSMFVTENGSEGLINLRFRADDPDAGEDGATLTYSLVAPHPNVTLDGSFLRANAQTGFEHLTRGETEQFTVQVQAEDTLGLTDVEDYVITVSGANDDPTMQDAAFSVDADGLPGTLDVTTLGDDLDGNDDPSTLTYTLVGAPAGASLLSNTLTFDPAELFNTLAEGQTEDVLITVQAEDSTGRTATGTVTVTVTGVNNAPEVADATLDVTEDGGPASLSLTALGSDVDDGEDGTTLDYFIQTPVAGASIIADDGGPRLQFDPGANFQNLAAGATQDVVVTIVGEDSQEAQSTGDVTVTVTGVNDAPTFTDVGTGISEDSALGSLNLSLFANDADDGEDGTTLTYHIMTGPTKGVADIDGNNITFNPNGEFEALGAGELENITVQVEARDGAGAASAIRTVTFTVTGANDAPVAPQIFAPYNFVTVPLEIDALGFALDYDSASISLDSVGEAGKGVVSIDDRGTGNTSDDVILYTADAGALGTDSFTYTVLDSDGASTTGTVTVELNNTAPTVFGESTSVQMISRRGADFFEAESAYYKFVRGYFTIDQADAMATAEGGRLASIRSQAENDFVGDLLVNTDVDAWIGASDSAVEGEWRWVTDGNDLFWQGDVDGSAQNGAYTNWFAGQPDAGATDASDHMALFRFGNHEWDDAIGTDGRGYLVEYGQQMFGISVASNDIELDGGDTLTYTLDAPVDGLTMSAGGFVTFDPHSDAYGFLADGQTLDVAVNYTATDRGGATAQGTLTLTVTGDNDAPDVVDDVAQITLQDEAGAPTTGGWTEWTIASGGNGHFYKLYEAPFLTRNQAEAARAAEGAHLATITSAAENAFLTNVVAPNFAGLIGGGDQVVEGEWRWTGGPEAGQQFWQGLSGGTAVNGSYENWKVGRPTSSSAEQLDVLFFDRDGTWFTASEATTANHYAEFSDTQFAVGSVALNDSDIDGDAITYALSGTYAGLTMAADGSWTFDRLDAAYVDLSDGEMAFVNAYYTATDVNGATSDGRLRLELTGVNNTPEVTDTTVDVDAGGIGTPPGAGWSEWTEAAGGNGHYYQFVPSNDFTWTEARADAALKGGYLGTITSAGEQAFVQGLAGGSVAFLGASDAAVEGEWRWVEGPETGQQFWQGDLNGSAIGGAYTNWNSGQPGPGAAGEDILHFFGDGTWNDLADIDTPSTTFGYILEYSGAPIVTGSIAGNATDAEGDAITFAATNAVAGASLDAAGNWTFNPNDPAYKFLAAGQTQTFNLTYTATDVNGAATDGTLGFNVTGVNDVPVFDNLNFGSVDENASMQFFDLLTAVTDPDFNDNLEVTDFTYQWSGDGPTPVIVPVGGSILEIDPADFSSLGAGETATLDMTYNVSDGTVALERTATFEITGVANPIAANDNNLSPEGASVTNEDIPETITAATLLANDNDPESLGISVIGVSQYSAQGASLILSGTNIFYNPTTSAGLNNLAAGQNATDTFTYTIESGDGLQQDTATVSLIVAGLAPSGDNDPVPFDVDGEGFEQGSANVYQVNPVFFSDNDAFTGITYKFSQISVDGALPDFLTFDPTTRNLTINGNFVAGDAGIQNLFLSGFEADGDFTVSPFQAQIGADGDFNWTLYGQNNAIGVSELLEVGIDSNVGLGDIVSGVLVDLSGLGAPLEDVEIIDLRNAQENDLTIEVDDVLALVAGNAANANEQIHVDLDTFDQFEITSVTDWTITTTGSNTKELAAVNGGAFDGMGVLATFYIDDGGSA
ncbi:MAG: VCBS domain-containing protein [Sulfitobacter sp.]